MKAQRTKKGFTLLELMVVIVIVGVLAAVSVPIILNAQRDARDSQRQTQLEAIRIAAAKVVTAKGGNTVRIFKQSNCTQAVTATESDPGTEVNTYFICPATGTSGVEQVRLTDFHYLVQRSSDCAAPPTDKAVVFYIQAGGTSSTGKMILCKEGGSTQDLEFKQS